MFSQDVIEMRLCFELHKVTFLQSFFAETGYYLCIT